MFNHYFKFLLLPVIILSFLLHGCVSLKKPIKIGYTAGLTGRQSQIAVFARAGVEVAIDEINEKGGINGRRLELVVKDNMEDPKQQQKVIQELLDQGVIAIVGPLLSKMADSTIQAIAGNNVIVISPTVSTDKIKGIDDNFLRIMPASSIQGNTIAKELLMTKQSRIAVVYDSSNKEYTESVFNSFRDQVVTAKRKIVYVNDLSDAKRDFYKIANDIKRIKADSLFIITSSINAAVLCQQLQKLRYMPPLYGSYWVKAGNIIQHGGKSVEGMIISSLYEVRDPSNEYTLFRKKILNLYKQNPVFVHDSAYDSVMVLAKGMALSKSLDPAMIKDAIIAQSTFNSLHGKIVIDKFGDVLRKQTVVKIKDGKYRHLRDIGIN